MTSKTHGELSQKYYLKLIEKNTIEEIIVNGNNAKSEQSIANEFNIFFINIGPNLANNISSNNKRIYTSYLTNVTASNFYFSPISQDDVSKIIASLRSKSSFGHDGMSTKCLKTLAPVLLGALTLIIRQSLTTGIFPDQLKIAKALTFHKKTKDLPLQTKLRSASYTPSSPPDSIAAIVYLLDFLEQPSASFNPFKTLLLVS